MAWPLNNDCMLPVCSMAPICVPPLPNGVKPIWASAHIAARCAASIRLNLDAKSCVCLRRAASHKLRLYASELANNDCVLPADHSSMQVNLQYSES